MSPEISNDVVFGIFSPENAKNDVVRNEGGNRAQEFLTTSFLAFSGLKMPKTTSLEIKPPKLHENQGWKPMSTPSQELQPSSLVPISSILRLHGSTPSQTNCPAAAGC